jgi:anti-sigma factor RsiW
MFSELCSQFNDELLERYALGGLPERQCAPLEEHLLVCTSCQHRLHRTDEYVNAVRGALRADAAPQSVSAEAACSVRLLRILATSRPAQVALGVVIVGLSVFLADISGREPSDVAHATLISVRSGDGIARAAAARSLVLDLDASLLPARPEYRMQMVDHSGREVWAGAVRIDGPMLRVRVDRRMGRGRYWVRLYGRPDGGDDLLREYGLEIE